MKRTPHKKARNTILGVLCFVTLVLLLSMGKRGFLQQIRVRQEKKKLVQEIEALEAQKLALEEEKKKLNDPAHVEKVAREDYGMAKKDEKVYRVVPKEKE